MLGVRDERVGQPAELLLQPSRSVPYSVGFLECRLREVGNGIDRKRAGNDTADSKDLLVDATDGTLGLSGSTLQRLGVTDDVDANGAIGARHGSAPSWSESDNA